MKKLKKHHICIKIITAIMIFVIVNMWFSLKWLSVRNYVLESEKVTDSIHIVILSDLHDHEFGPANKRLVERVSSQSPDLILLNGDFLNEDSANTHIVCDLIESLSDFAPVYFALGNHEEIYMKNHPELLHQLESAGAVVLEESYVDLDINGTALRLGGMYGYAFGSDAKSGENVGAAVRAETGTFLKDFQDTDRLKIMMSHRPDSFIFGDAASYWDIDLVVSGHNHGGQVVVPFLGGLYGGDQGWFPKYVHGMYEKDGMPIFITSGLGSYGQKVPRVNNLPEIAVLEINPK